MEQTFLVAGNPAKLNIDIAHEILSQKQRVLVTIDPETTAPPIPAGLETGLQYVEWNRRSPISARFVILQAVNKQMDIDHAILVFSPKNQKSLLHEAASSTIEETIDFDIKGNLFLLKELISYFLKRGKGSLTFLSQNSEPDVLPPIESLLESSFQGLAESIFAQYQNEPIVIRGIETKLSANRQIADFAFQVIMEDQPRSRGKWIKYTGKSGLFSFGR